MVINDVVQVVLQLVLYCAPAAFVINLSGYAVRVVLDAVTGKGINL